ncbi:MAG: response regulator transcription factor [Bacteroidetes bacterium]|nr:response regulator transcription factor [Bacteroidota bacterium]
MICKIAISEDHVMVRQGLKSLLNDTKKYNVTIEASNGIELLEALKNASELPRLCIVDIFMPLMNGIDVMNEISKNYPGIDCIAISMDNSSETLTKAKEAGAKAFVLKENAIEELVVALDRVIKSDLYYHNSLLSYEYPINNISTPEQSNKGSETLLTRREIEFLMHYSTGLRYKDIAEIMNVSIKTLNTYRDHICDKLDIHGRSNLIVYARKLGLLNKQ